MQGVESGGRWRVGLTIAGVAAATLIAFRSVLIAPFGLKGLAHFDYWFFIPDRDSGALSVLIALWLLWNRRRQLASMSRQSIGATHWLAASAVLFLFSWATWMRLEVQLIPALCALIATLVVAWGGRSALGLVAMPCLALLLAFPPPPPLQAEILWRLQGLTAGGAYSLLSLAGYAPRLEGTEVQMGDYAFVIIEACSGWRGIQVLALIGLAAAELCGLTLRRAICVVLAAVPLGILLNILRACLVMLTQEELKAEYFESHTPQGIAVLLVGSVLLYAIAMWIRPSVEVASPDGRNSRPSTSEGSLVHWAALGLGLPIVLAVISLLVPYTQDPIPERRSHRFTFPQSLGPWTGARLDPDYFFPYSTPFNSQFHFDYRTANLSGGGGVVDLFVAREFPTASGSDRIPDSKLLLPASDWSVVSRNPARVLQLGVDAEEAIVARDAGEQVAYVLAWRLHDRGLAREALRSLVIGQDCARSPEDCLRTVVRIVVWMRENDATERERAVRTVNRFIDHFMLPLKTIELI